MLLLVPGVPSLAARRIGAFTPEQSVRAMIRMCFGEPGRVPPERIEQAVQEVRERAEQPWADHALTRSMRGLITSYLRVGAANAWRAARMLRTPTLVVWGARDKLVSTLPSDVLWYHADYVAPAWGKRLTRSAQIGLHIFYS